MNKYIVLLGFLLLFASCSGDKATDVDLRPLSADVEMFSTDEIVKISSDGREANVLFTSQGGEVFVNVDSFGEKWTSSVEGGWIVSENEPSGIRLKADENTTEETLTAKITIVVGEQGYEATATINIVQRTAYGKDIDVDNADVVMAAGGSYPEYVEIITDSDNWDFDIKCNWLSAEKVDDYKLELRALANVDIEERSTVVTILIPNGEGTLTKEINVVQQSKAYMEFDKNNLSMYSDSGNESLAITTNKEWSYSVISGEPTGWLSITKSEQGLDFEVTANTDSDERSVVLEVVSGEKDNKVSQAFTLRQISGDRASMVFLVDVPANFKPSSDKVALPLAGTVNCTINWGDGTVEKTTAQRPEYNYNKSGKYYVTVSGTVTQTSSLNANRIKYLSQIMRWGKTGLTSLEGVANGMTALKYIPEDVDGSLAKVTSFKNAFAYCTNITEVPEGLFKNSPDLEDVSGMFAGTSVTTIPEKLFEKCPKIKTMATMFSTTNVTSIPSDLLSYTPNVTDLGSLFYKCKMESIPAGLFDNVPNVTSINNIFDGCDKLKEVPAGLFKKLTKLESLQRALANCKLLESVPADLFNAPLATGENGTLGIFAACSKLETVPEGIFDSFVAATSYKNVFNACAALKSVPETLFAKSVEALDFSYAFYGCTSLTEVPEKLFEKNTEVINFGYSFYGCTKLASIPAQIFAGNVNATDFSRTFQNCTALTAIPADLFDNNKKVANFSYTFFGSKGLTGESPYTMVGTEKVHLYERANHTSVFTVPSTTTGCFRNATGLSDYATMPTAWK